VLVQEGSPGDDAFVLVSGGAEVVVGGRRVARIAPGELFGEIAALDGGVRSATVVTTAPSRVAVLDRRTTAELLQRPGVGLGVAARLAAWLRRAQCSPEHQPVTTVLTEAEQNVAGLVVEGLTNREIGARLHVSPYTVDAHLRHIYTKLGISSRVELAARTLRASTGARAGTP
jgi:DNA-binding CsgD family transcriptional regulator